MVLYSFQIDYGHLLIYSTWLPFWDNQDKYYYPCFTDESDNLKEDKNFA